MKILVLNANTTQAVTDRMVAALAARCGPDVELVGATAAFGMPYVASRAAAAVAGHAALEAVRAAVAAEHAAARAPFDACLYACFGEPGIEAIREDAGFPVAGMAEASILTALQLGARFSIVTVGTAWPPMLQDLMRRTALDARCAGIGVVPGDALSLASNHQDGAWAVERVVGETIEAQAPDVVIIGGAALAGYADALTSALAVPVLDSLVCGFEQAMALARLCARGRRGPAG